MQIKIKKQDLDVEFLNKLNRLVEHLMGVYDKEAIWEEREVEYKTWYGKTKFKKETRRIDKYIRYIEVYPYYSGGYGVWRENCFKWLSNFCVLPLDKELILSEYEWMSLQQDIKWYDKYLGKEDNNDRTTTN